METLAILACLLLVILISGVLFTLVLMHNPIIALTVMTAVIAGTVMVAKKLDR